MVTLVSKEVTLTDEEMLEVRRIGLLRNKEAYGMGLKDKRGPEDGENSHVVGAAGELAFAKCLGIDWPKAINTFKEPDFVIKRAPIQVRTKKLGSKTELIFRKADNPDHAYVLMVQTAPNTYRVAGWRTGQMVMKWGEYKNPGNLEPAWFMDELLLNPIEKLVEVLNANI